MPKKDSPKNSKYFYVCKRNVENNGEVKLEVVKKIQVQRRRVSVPRADKPLLGRYPHHLLRNIMEILDE